MMNKNILCIDDIQANLFTISSVLEVAVDYKYNIFTALCAHDGLEILLKEKIDIILLDVMMPEIDGYETAKIIKSNKKTKNIPIIFVTAKKDDESISRCYEVGGDDYINKPFNYVELLSRVAFHLKLKEKSYLLAKEREFNQNILDLQNNFILVTDSRKTISVNNSILNFFDFKNLAEFQEKCGCIANKFIKEDGYFSIAKDENRSLWIENLLKKLDNEDVVVKMMKNNEEFVFTIKVNKYQDYFIITLTDITQITNQNLEYKHDANFDALTQIYNRNMFNRLVFKKISMAKVNKKPFVFILFDIDLFKKVNDTYGHLLGDKVLKDISRLVESHTRDSDIFARWGGEEFTLTFDVRIKKGMEIAESLRKYIENENFEGVGKITCSFGVTQYKENDKIDDILARADKALYEAKQSGRNRVCQA